MQPRSTTCPVLLVALAVSLLAGTAGCMPIASRPIDGSRIFESPELLSPEPAIQWGERRPIVDGVGWVLGIPSKIVLWDRRAENHRITVETEAAIEEYLRRNQLQTVRVRLNQYRPGEDWSRLTKNRAVGPGWRYTFGALSVLGETVFPGRIFGGDHYNPFTNTIHIYSDIPAVALHEGAHAKDFLRRKWRGTYAAVYGLPLVPLYHESIASSDVVAYLEQFGDPSSRAEAARVLYPAYGTYVGSAAGNFLPEYSNPLYIGAVLTGHAIGRSKARSYREAE